MTNGIYFGIHPDDPALQDPRLHRQIILPVKRMLGLEVGYEIPHFPNFALALAAANDAAAHAPIAFQREPSKFVVVTDGVGNKLQVEQLLRNIPPFTYIALISVGANGGKNAPWLRSLLGPQVTLVIAELGDTASQIAIANILHGGNQN